MHQKPTAEAIKTALGVYIRKWGSYPREVTNSAKSFDRMWEAVLSYIEHYPPATDHVQPYRTEGGVNTSEFTISVRLLDPAMPRHPVTGEPFVYTGRFDMLGDYQGSVCIRDEKTTASFRKDWADSWDLRSQFLGYVWACQQYGLPVETVVVRGIAILKTDIRHQEAIKIYPSFMIERWYFQLHRDLTRLVRCWKAGYFDYNPGDSCSSYSGCQFRSLCTSNDESRWYPDYTIRHWNPLAVEGDS